MSTEGVELSPELVEMIARECAAAPGVETGGLILVAGERASVTGPGPAAVRTPDRLEWDASFIAGALTVAADLGAELLGRWHKHTSPVILASSADAASAEQLRRALGGAEFCDLIVACDREDQPIGWSAYHCTEGGYERIQVTLPQEAEA